MDDKETRPGLDDPRNRMGAEHSYKGPYFHDEPALSLDGLAAAQAVTDIIERRSRQ